LGQLWTLCQPSPQVARPHRAHVVVGKAAASAQPSCKPVVAVICTAHPRTRRCRRRVPDFLELRTLRQADAHTPCPFVAQLVGSQTEVHVRHMNAATDTTVRLVPDLNEVVAQSDGSSQVPRSHGSHVVVAQAAIICLRGQSPPWYAHGRDGAQGAYMICSSARQCASPRARCTAPASPRSLRSRLAQNGQPNTNALQHGMLCGHVHNHAQSRVLHQKGGHMGCSLSATVIVGQTGAVVRCRSGRWCPACAVGRVGTWRGGERSRT
jgi:hypothetical protein